MVTQLAVRYPFRECRCDNREVASRNPGLSRFVDETPPALADREIACLPLGLLFLHPYAVFMPPGCNPSGALIGVPDSLSPLVREIAS